MKKIVTITFLILSGITLFSQQENKVIGVWLTEDGHAKIKISKDASGKFIGQIIWIKVDQPTTDKNNPDDKLKNRSLIGLNILSGFMFNKSENEWIDGTIYDPKSGSTYSCKMWFEDDPDILYVKGYIGFSFIGRKAIFAKVK